jgi:hypothetical protein
VDEALVMAHRDAMYGVDEALIMMAEREWLLWMRHW